MAKITVKSEAYQRKISEHPDTQKFSAAKKHDLADMAHISSKGWYFV
jgi:hypothetical protein